MRRAPVLILVALLVASLVAPLTAQASLTLLRPNPLVSGTFYGHGALSTDASSEGSVQAEIPAGSTVVGAWVYAAATPWASEGLGSLAFAGQTISMTTINQDGGGAVSRGDVTSLVADTVTSEGGTYTFPFTNPGVEGVALAVIYSNPAEPQRTIAILDGGSLPTGDSATFNFAAPIDPTANGFDATLALGITFSYQNGVGDHVCGVGQVSHVDVNGARMTSCAGGADDSTGSGEGGLITMGGVGDSTDNPPDPNGPGGQDDELYDLVPFLHQGDESLTVATVNPSNDDYIFFAGIAITARASVSTTGAPTIGAVADQSVPAGTSTGSLAFTVGDAETDPADLTVTASSSDSTVAADADVLLGGSGANRTAQVSTHAVGQTTVALTVTDGDGNQAVSSFLVEATEVPADPVPVAADDTASTDEDTLLEAPSVLANDTTSTEGPMTAVLVDDAGHGTLDLAEDGTYTYQPDADFNGTDTFTYRAVDGNGSSDPATVTITVAALPDAPRCDDGTLSVDLDTPTAGSVHCWSPDGASPWIGTTGTAPAHGTVTDLDHDAGTFTYTPDAGFHGTDAIWFAAAVDGVPDSGPAKITVTVAGGNADPVAVDDDASVDEALAPTATPIDVLANDTDADEDALTIDDVTTPGHGTAVIADGKIAYTPDSLYAGTDTFSYTVVDGFGGSATGTVHVTVVADTTGPAVALPRHRFVAPATAGRSSAAVRFSWVAPTDATGVIGYDVELAKDSGAFVTLRSASPLLSIDRSLEIGHWYQLRVRSVDGAGNRGPWATESRFALRANQTPAFRYRGTWVIVTRTSSAGTGYRYTTRRGASATITVTGKSFAWIAPTNRASGLAEVLVDGIKVGTVSLWSSTSHQRQVVFSMAFAQRGTHTVTIRNLATSGHPRMSLDALFVLTR